MVKDKFSSKLPEGFGVQNTYTELMPGSKSSCSKSETHLLET